MAATTHTETPWKVHNGNSRYVLAGDGEDLAYFETMYEGGSDTADANATFAVQCVNTHEQLTLALRHILSLATHLHPEPHTYIIEAEAALKAAGEV